MGYCSFDSGMHFVQEEYGRQPTFSSFLPGIAGPWGIPAWCNYNNRGQAICSFGVQDKDHAILEFTAASTAYQRTALTGFRTFLKCDGIVMEPFADGTGTMTIEPNVLSIWWKDSRYHVEVQYFTLPNERMAGLCRKLSITNIANSSNHIELLDGLATIVPYGIKDEKLKQEANLSTAWMQVEQVKEKLPYFRVRASLEDTAKVSTVRGCNFRIAFGNDGKYLPALVQPDLIFGWDSAMIRPIFFESNSLSEILATEQLTGNYLPCCMTAWEGDLPAGTAIEIWEFYGQTEDSDEIESFCKKAAQTIYFERKLEEARFLVQEIASAIKCTTANPVFDSYVQQNFLDNVLRGGFPHDLDGTQKNLPVYLYSRKHGDPEREYNFFSLNREYFSQGNANFRDICQNRRSDVAINPKAGEFNLQLFFELIQADGYNPLVIEPVSYLAKHPDDLIQMVGIADRASAREILSKHFSFGQLAMEAERWQLLDKDTFLAAVIEDSEMEPNAKLQEGYWSDHWTYLMDLLESELSIFPDKERELLFGEPRYRWFAAQATVRPQIERYCMTDNGIRQYNCIARTQPENKWMVTQDGQPAKSNLFEKLLLLCAIKSATLDISGAAIEMEGGKPGWYDAMNGLPGLLGANVADGCELLRILDYLLGRVMLFPEQIEVYQEIFELLRAVSNLEISHKSPHGKWIARNELRNQYRAQTKIGFSGVRIKISADEIFCMLNRLSVALKKSIDVAIEENGGICPTYFYYQVERDANILVEEPIRVSLPLFLEGPTRWLRTEQAPNKKQKMVAAISQSALMDPKLKMYKLNASLADLPYEVGRARAFPAGWLENESIWLHMEYKYLLALLECEMYDQFFADFHNAAIPFLSPEMYKRSTLENSSFLLSSANQDAQSHGRGYVSRLSGSTAEFISIWNHMLFGKTPFGCDDFGLHLRFQPAIPHYLIGEEQTITVTFLGKITVVYHMNGLTELKPGGYKIESYILNQHKHILGDTVPKEYAARIRGGKVNRIDVFFERV